MIGGCACGAVRFRLDAQPTDAGWCHCRTCQRTSGSPAMAFATVQSHAYVYEKGADRVRRFASSDTGRRGFCGGCGTPLFMQDDAAPETLDFSIATLDVPEAVPPGFHIYYPSRIDWAPAADNLPRYDSSREAARC